MIDFNRRAGDGERLVAVYPEEGTFFSDNPLITLAGRLGDAGAGGARARCSPRSWPTAVTPEVAGRQGFRPADPDVAPAGPA